MIKTGKSPNSLILSLSMNDSQLKEYTSILCQTFVAVYCGIAC